MMLTCIYPVQKKRGFKKRTLDTDVKAGTAERVAASRECSDN